MSIGASEMRARRPRPAPRLPVRGHSETARGILIVVAGDRRTSTTTAADRDSGLWRARDPRSESAAIEEIEVREPGMNTGATGRFLNGP
jgi:hypothetical protein